MADTRLEFRRVGENVMLAVFEEHDIATSIDASRYAIMVCSLQGFN